MEEAFWDSSDDLMAAVFSVLHDILCGWECIRAIEETWKTALIQIRAVVDHVVFPAIDLVLAVFFFGKLGTAYFDFRKHGQFEWSGPAILFACLVFTLTAPTYIWQILGM